MKKILHIFMVLFLVGCYSPNKLKEIKYEEIFKVIEKRYIVLFYSSSCKACLNTLELLNKRIEKEKQLYISKKTNKPVKMIISNSYIVIKSTKEIPTFFKILSKRKNIFICDFINKDYFWLSNI